MSSVGVSHTPRCTLSFDDKRNVCADDCPRRAGEKHKMTGYVQWFDKSSGEGMVVGDNGESYYCHWSTIEHGKRGEKNLDAGRRVHFTLYTNIYSSRVESVRYDNASLG